MKTAGLWLVMLLLSAAQLCAQVKIELKLEQEQFLSGEALNVLVKISNQSGQTLNLGSDEGWLKFAVESRDGFIVLKDGEAPVAEKIVLESAHAVIKRVNIAPYFNLKKPGSYSVIATAYIKDWERQITSAPLSFDVIHAATLGEEVEFGMPLAAGATNLQPEVRKYTLLQANHLQKLTLYFQLSDKSGKLNRVFALGPMLNISLPEKRLDRLSNLHVLYQIGAHSVCYTVLNPEGEIIKRQTYDFSTRPRLRFNDEGNVEVVGATRRERPDDLPPAKILGDGAKTPAPN
jgi:hypothetical protein